MPKPPPKELPKDAPKEAPKQPWNNATPKEAPKPVQPIEEDTSSRVHQIGHILTGWLDQLISLAEDGPSSSEEDEPEHETVIRIVQSNAVKLEKAASDVPLIVSILVNQLLQ